MRCPSLGWLAVTLEIIDRDCVDMLYIQSYFGLITFQLTHFSHFSFHAKSQIDRGKCVVAVWPENAVGRILKL